MNLLQIIVLDILYADMNRYTIFDRADYKRALVEAESLKEKIEQYTPSSWYLGYLKSWWLSRIEKDIKDLCELLDDGICFSGTLPDGGEQ